jgi:hypothetical protein
MGVMAQPRQRFALILILVLALLVVLFGLTWANYHFAAQVPGGNDFLPRWVGARLFLLQGQSPYSPETSLAIQKMIYGRPATLGEDQSLFVYPFYTILVFGPFAMIGDYNLARAAWMTFLELSAFGLAAVSVSLARWKLSGRMLVVLFVFTAFWYHGFRPVINGNAAVFCALVVAAAFLMIRDEQDVLAGILLALATIKPQAVVLLAVYVLIWAASQRRWKLIGSFLGSLGVLAALSSLLSPGWLVGNLTQILAYPGYTLPGSPGAIFAAWWPDAGKPLGWVVTVLVTGCLVWAWRAGQGRAFGGFLWTAYLTLLLTNLVGIRTATENYILLYPALVLVLATWDQQGGRAGRWLVAASYLLLFVGLWGLFLATIQRGDQAVQSPVMFFPLPIFLLLGMFSIHRSVSSGRTVPLFGT